MNERKISGPVLRLFFLICGLTPWLFPSEGLSEADNHFRKAAAAAKDSLVVVKVQPANGEERAGEAVNNTGIIVDERGHVLTSLHALAGASAMEVVDMTGTASPAELKAVHQPAGLGLLSTELDGTAVSFADKAPSTGDWVIIGKVRSDGLPARSPVLMPALVSIRDVKIRCHGTNHDNLIAFFSESTNGAASAPLFDREGQVAGILLTADRESVDGRLCYALPGTEVSEIVEELVTGESTRAGWLGVAVTYLQGREGVMVVGVLGESPAHINGLRPGDVLLAIDGDVIGSEEVFMQKVTGYRPGSTAELRIRREGEEQKLEVSIGARPLAISRMTNTPMAEE